MKEIDELEILFTTIKEIGGLDGLVSLRKLAMLDNGLIRISNLSPVRNTLSKLTLCDQDISVIEGLDLPNLRELYLHRNCITRISGLERCPRLKKFWIFHNRISDISGIHALPELEECWLQTNNISDLSDITLCTSLKSLGLAGNPISSFTQVEKLKVGI